MDDEELVTDQTAESTPQPQTSAASMAPKEDEKKSEPAKPEKPEDAKMTGEDLAKKIKEDTDKKAAEDFWHNRRLRQI